MYRGLLNHCVIWFGVVLGTDAAILDWKVKFLFVNLPQHLRTKLGHFVQRTQDKWFPTSTSYIRSEHSVGDSCHNKIQYDMKLVKKLILKKDGIPTASTWLIQISQPYNWFDDKTSLVVMSWCRLNLQDADWICKMAAAAHTLLQVMRHDRIHTLFHWNYFHWNNM